MVPVKNIVGQRFGKLVVLCLMEERTKNHKTVWKCLCDCGNICYVLSNSLQSGRTNSCGCIKSAYMTELGKKYGGNTIKDLTNMRFEE